MTKSLSHLLSAGALSLSLLATPAASAEVIFTETFDYPVGDLYGNPGWLQSNNKENPIQVTATTLSLDGFASGKSVKLTPIDAKDQDVLKPFYAASANDTYTAIADGSVYAAFLINVQNVTNRAYVTGFGSTNSYNKITDGSSITGPYGITFVSPSESEGKYFLGISKSSTKTDINKATTLSNTELDYNTTYLVVLKYTVLSGTSNDTFEAWINPVAGAAEPATADVTADSSKGDPLRGLASFAICQTSTFDTNAPEMLVGPVRIATTWAELWSEGGDTPDPGKAEITPGKVSFPEGFALYQYQKYTTTVKVKAQGITEDIAISGNANVKPAVTAIPAAEACSAAGYDLTLTLDATAGTEINETLAFTSGKTTASLPVKAAVYPASTPASFRFIPSMQPYETYYFSGKATVTFVDAANKKIYLQDVVGGMALDYSMTNLEAAPFKLGDQLTKLYIMGDEPSFGVPVCHLMGYFAPEGISYGTVSATGQTKQPIELTLAELNADRKTYLNRLVKITDVKFGDAGSSFGTAGTDITSGEATGNVRVFAGTDIIGTAIPETAKAVIGISTSPSTTMITMRSLADLIASPADEEKLEVTEQLLVDANEYYPVNVTTPFAKFTVKAQNLAKAAAIYVTGKDRSHFSADLTEIPAGTGEYVITVSFNPTSTGRKQGNLMIETSNTELTYNKGFAAQAYDPDNLPVFSVDNSAVTEFSAKVGDTQEQTVTINATGLLDYGSIRVLGQGNGAFRIGSTMFLKDGQTALKVTFAPTAEGTFTEVIEFSADKAETKTITVTGKTTGGAVVGDKEGDELVFDTTNPLTYYATDFSNSGARNKPLVLEGWKNVAVQGNRAWWSYTDGDNTVAKVTSYIWGGATSDEPTAEMLLLSPALDYKNCTSRLLSFRIKGENLTDAQMGQLSVLYIDPTLPETER